MGCRVLEVCDVAIASAAQIAQLKCLFLCTYTPLDHVIQQL